MSIRSIKKAPKRSGNWLSRTTVVFLGAIALSNTLAACATNEAPSAAPPSSAPATTTVQTPTTPALSGTINAGGASAQSAAQEAWRAAFQNEHNGVTVNYDPQGSGVGRTNFAEGGYTIAGTDSAFKAEEANGPFASCAPGTPLVEIPAYISPIAVAFNLPNIQTLNLDAATIAEIFSGKITDWSDKKITDQNSGVTIPKQKITPVHRSDESGTSENFTDYLSKAAPKAWTFEPSGDWPKELAGEAVEKTQGVREALTQTVGAIGYLDASQATELGKVSIKVGDSYVAYSPEAAALAVEKSPMAAGRAASDIVVELDRTLADPTTYPVVLISYLAACSQYVNPADGELAKAYLSYIISSEGQQAAAANAGSAPMSPGLVAKAEQAVSAIK